MFRTAWQGRLGAARLGRQGLSALEPRRFAAGFTLGALLGILPIPWGTSLLALTLGLRLRLNPLLIQSLNAILWPLQLMLMIPFFRWGGRLAGTDPGLLRLELLSEAGLLSLPEIWALLWRAQLGALALWAALALPAGALLYGFIRGGLFWIFNKNKPDVDGNLTGSAQDASRIKEGRDGFARGSCTADGLHFHGGSQLPLNPAQSR